MPRLLIVGAVFPQADGLAMTHGFEVVRLRETAGDVTEAIAENPDVLVIMRSGFLDANSALLIPDLYRQERLQLLVITDPDAADAYRFLLSGAAGLLHPDLAVEDLFALLPRVLAGEISAPPLLIARALREAVLSNRQADLTTRERQVFQLAGEGLTNRKIAEILQVTRETVRWHLRSINAKLGRNTVELLRRKRQIVGAPK
jgi:DNA-binding NarL/FixJ family response regulator